MLITSGSEKVMEAKNEKRESSWRSTLNDLFGLSGNSNSYAKGVS